MTRKTALTPTPSAPEGALPARRGVLALTAAVPLALLMPGRAHARPTPSATEGPFYPLPEMRFDDADNDLVKIEGAVREAGGEVIRLEGRVLDRSATPLKGARVEIWQCDANRRYLHTGDHGSPARDGGFQGFGHYTTGPDGAYSFRTIMPVPYPGRTPHIHVKVRYGRAVLTTQFYIDGHAQNTSDWLFMRMSPAEQQAVAMRFSRKGQIQAAKVDIVL